MTSAGPVHPPVPHGTPHNPDGLDQSDVARAQSLLLRSGSSAAGRAVTLYRRAAARGNALAQYNLGFCYETGMGVAVDKTMAALWYRKAAVNGSNEVVRQMARARIETLTETASTQTP